MGKLVLIDGHSILFRAFYGMPGSMTAPDGLHTGAIYGFLTILGKVLAEEEPDYLAVAMDLPVPTFRHRLYPEYKGNREKAPDEFREQVPVLKELLAHMGIPVLTCEGYEADDILGTLAAKAAEAGVEVALVSGDRDLLQIADEKIEIILPKTRGGQTTYEHYGPGEVKAAYGVTPAGFIQLKALMGDSSDNVPGLPGVGPKTAQKIMETFGSIEGARDHLAEIRPKKAMEAMRDHYEDLMLSLDLVTIRKDAPVEFDKERFALGEIYNDVSYADFRRLGFKSFLNRFERSISPEAEGVPSREVTTAEELRKLSEDLRKEASAGLSVLKEGNRLYAAGISTEKENIAVLTGGELGEAEVTAFLRELLLHTDCAVTQAKELLKITGIRGGAKLFDCIIASYLLDPLKSDWSYDAVAMSCFSETVPPYEELFGKKGLAEAEKREEFRTNLIRGASVMAETARRARPVLSGRLREQGMWKLFDEIEMPLAGVLASMEKEGILVSREELASYGARLAARIDELTLMIYGEAGEEFNLNSPKQLGAILFEKMGLPGGKKTKTGYSTAADVLEKLSSRVPMVAHILEYRTLSKLKSTYADGLSAYIDDDSRIRTTFHQTITATGRLSSADPNLQNIPMREELGRLIRKCFYPKAGCVFVDADYSQIELRILAHMSGDEKLIAAYGEEKDIHRITASQVFHVPFDEVTDLERRNAKAVNFGIVYGISSFGLSQGLSISRQEAQEYIDLYFATYPGISRFLKGLVESAKEKGYAVSLFGRRRPVPELRAANYAQRSFGERVAMNSPIQGTAADIMKIAMLRVYRRLADELPGAKLILQIHDELLVECPEKDAEAAECILREEMMAAADLRVALMTDCHIGGNWYDAK